MTTSALMAKKKTGRPATSERDDKSVKFDRHLADLATMIAKGRKVSLAEYLSEAMRDRIQRDYADLMEKFRADPSILADDE